MSAIKSLVETSSSCYFFFCLSFTLYWENVTKLYHIIHQHFLGKQFNEIRKTLTKGKGLLRIVDIKIDCKFTIASRFLEKKPIFVMYAA